ncbi:MAG: IclR family transcriptional regulator [Acidimicrobiia bacterium]
MARPAPAIDRTVALVTFLAAHPGRSFTLSELARRLDLNKATAHAMVNALAAEGWLVREPADKTYRLGAALISIGDAAAATERAVLDTARPAMRSLAAEFGVQVVASVMLGDDIVILGSEGEDRSAGVGAPPGHRVALRPPIGTVFIAFAESEIVDRWLGQLHAEHDGARVDAYRAALERVRREGYATGLDDRRHRIGRALADLMNEPASKPVRAAVEGLISQLHMEDEYLLVDLDPHAEYHLRMMSAPVFGADGRVVLAISLSGFGESVGAEQVPVYGRRLAAVAAEVTAAIHGRSPATAVRTARSQAPMTTASTGSAKAKSQRPAAVS